MFPVVTFSTHLGIKMKPILDAFWAPFRKKFRFSVGLRLLLRVIPHATAYLIPQPMNILLLGMFSISLLFLQVVIHPFQGFMQNVLDYFFISNIILLVMGALYFEIFITAHQENHAFEPYHREQYIYFTVFVTMAYVAFLLVILWHIQYRFPSICRALFSLVSKIRMHKTKVDIDDIAETASILQAQIQADSDGVAGSGEHSVPPWPGSEEHPEGAHTRNNSYGSQLNATKILPPIVNYSVLREPLLDEGVADLVPATN